MELNGKCREEFEEWYKVKYYPCHYGMDNFNECCNSMKYGVYQDYFESVNLFPAANYLDNLTTGDNYYAEVVDDISVMFYSDRLDSMNKARTAAIEKANELRNEILNKKDE